MQKMGNKLELALTLAVVALVAIPATAVLGVQISSADVSAAFGTLTSDILATFATVAPLALVLGLGLIAGWAGMRQVFAGGKTAANKK